MTGLERVGENLAIAGCMSYAYDGAGQLVSYRRGQNTETYGYDLLGNRTFRKTNGARDLDVILHLRIALP